MFKTLVYIIYKIINNLLFYVLVKLNVVQSNIAITRHTQIYLNLNHKTTHLGDRLFLWDLLHEDALERQNKDTNYLSHSILILPVNQDLTSDDINNIIRIINAY